MWAVRDPASTKTLDTKSSGELPWLGILSFLSIVTRPSREEVMSSRIPQGKDNRSFMFGHHPDLTLCISSFGWFSFVSFCYNQTLTLSRALSSFVWVDLVNDHTWGRGNPQVCSQLVWCSWGYLCAFHVYTGFIIPQCANGCLFPTSCSVIHTGTLQLSMVMRVFILQKSANALSGLALLFCW